MKIPSSFRLRLSAGVLACISTFCLQGYVQAQNLISNPGFETNTTGWGMFAPKEAKDKCHISAVTEAPHTGGACLKMESDAIARFAASPKGFRVQPKERYQVTAWVRGTAEIKSGEPGFLIRLTLSKAGNDAPGGHLYIGLDSRVSHGTPPGFSKPVPAQWTKIEAVVEIPDEVETVGPGLFVWNAKGTVYVDDVAIEKVPATTALSSMSTSSGEAQNAVKKDGPVATNEEALAALNLDAPGMEDVKAAAKTGSLEAVQKAYLEYRRTKCPAKWHVSPDKKPAVAKSKTDEAGDELCAHLLRSKFYRKITEPVDMGKDFDWTLNPVKRGDPDFTEEWTWCVVSRMYFWDKLSNAYWNTLDEKYAQEWVAQLFDFAKKNNRLNKLAPGESSRWRTLDASERAYASWPDAYYHFLNSPNFTPEAQWTYMRVMLDHVALLKKGLENTGRYGNWVASECFGLYAIGVLFPELKEAQSWRDIALNRLVDEANLTVPPDGFEAELATGYHYFSLSNFTGPMRLANLNQLPVPKEFRAKVLAMFTAPVTVMDQTGNAVGTNDSGPTNASALAKQGLTLVGDDPVLAWAASGGKEGKPLPATTMLPYAGFYAMRGGWNRDDSFLFFRAGPTGIGHEHEDMLEVVLRAWNKTLLFDPGNYMYDHSNWRRFTIGTASHNTIIVDGKWQHRGANKPPVTEPVKNPWHTTPLFDFVSGCYDGGYQQNVYNSNAQYSPGRWVGDKDISVSHTRRVLFLKPFYALLVDTLDGTGKHQYDAHFHMDAPSATLDPATQAITSQNPAGQAQLTLFPLDRDGLKADIVQGQEEPILGWFPPTHRPIPTARYSKTQEAPSLFATFLYPFKGEAPRFEAKPLPIDKAFWASALKTGHEDAEIVLAKDDTARDVSLNSSLAGALKAKTSGLVIRHLTQSGKTVFGAWKLSAYADKAASFTLAEPAALVWTVQEGRLLAFNPDPEKQVRLKVTAPFAVEAALPPGAWMEITKTGANPAASPLEELASKPATASTDLSDYKAYLAQFSQKKTRAASKPIRLPIESFTLPQSVTKTTGKVDAQGVAITGWDEANSAVTGKVNLPEAGWYHLKVRYCSQWNALRSILIGGTVPFASAASNTLSSTLGEPPSDGWSNSTNDWKELLLGAERVPGGWKFYLPAGETTISLRNEDNSGCNLNWVELVPAAK